MKNVVGALCVLAVASCHHASEEHEEPIPVSVHCMPVKRESVEMTQTMRGRIAAPPGFDLPVASQVSGRIVEVLVHEGDHIAPGAMVAVIDGSNSRDALQQADAAVLQAKSAEANAMLTLERTKQLVARGIAAKQELDDATARADQSHAGVTATVAAADLARRTLGRVQVRSTFAGNVTRVWRGVGALVDGTAATPIVQMAAADLAEFDADVTERQLMDIATGQSASVTLAVGGDPITGTVRARSSALDPATGLGLVRIAMEAKGPITLGVFGTATITVGKRDDVLVVPTTALRGAVADGAEVAVCAEGKAEIRTVRVGWRDDQRVEAAEGLKEGERVAVDHSLGLENGSPIIEEK